VGLATSGIRSGVTAAEQAAPGILAKLQGGTDSALNWVAQRPAQSMAGGTGGGFYSGVGGERARAISKASGATEEEQNAAETLGQIAAPGSALAALKMNRLAPSLGTLLSRWRP
jgi:hypothetical protein